jgi:RimJ/RimL family protein N-acetyltransferase
VEPADAIEIRPMTSADIDATFDVFAAVAAEGRWIARELPIDREESRVYLQGQLDNPDAQAFVARDPATGELVGQIGLTLSPIGVVDLGMMVADGWRGRGVGSALLVAGVEWARQRDAHKMALQVWPHNERAIGLYEKYGFAREGVLRQHYRRANGDLWDAIVMGLLLEP